MLHTKYFPLILVSLLTSFTALAADEDTLTMNKEVKNLEITKEGWHPSLNLGANISFGSSSNVIGQTDGDSRTYGANLDGALHYKKRQDEWQNTLKIKGATSKTPALPRYVKSNDELDFTSIYLHSLKSYDWLGPYIRVNAKTSIFYGEDVRSEVVTYERRTRKGVVKDTVTGNSLRLTDGFKPLSTKESVGMFAKIIHKKEKKLIARLGVGALQVDASGQYIVKDDESTTNVEVQQLQSYTQTGVEGGFDFSNTIDKKTNYKLSFDFLTPINPDLEVGDNRDDLEMTNLELNFKLTSKVYEWMSFSYDYNLKSEPQLLPNKMQETHLLSLGFAYTLL